MFSLAQSYSFKLVIKFKVWFQNKRARYRKKMTKRDENGRIKSAIKIQEEKSLEASSPEPRTELKYLESSSSTPEAASRLGKSSIMDDSGYKSSILADITTCVGNHYQAQVSFSASHSNLAYRGYAFNSPQLNSSSSSPSTVISSFVPAYYGDSSTPYTRFYATDSVSSYWSSPASFEPSLGHAYSTPRLATTSTKRTAIFRPYE